MPRLPTIRVIGSQDISLTITLCCSGVSVAICVSPQAWNFQGDVGRSPALDVAGLQGPAALAPRRFLVVVVLDVAVAHELHDWPVRELDDPLGCLAPRVLIHERHVFVGEPGHRAGHAYAADVRAAAHAVDPAAHRHVALDHRSLASELDQAAVIGAVFGGELTLFAEARAVA